MIPSFIVALDMSSFDSVLLFISMVPFVPSVFIVLDSEAAVVVQGAEYQVRSKMPMSESGVSKPKDYNIIVVT